MYRLPRSLITLAMLLAFYPLVSSPLALAAPASLDPTFGNEGKVTIDGASASLGFHIVSDDKILLASSRQSLSEPRGVSFSRFESNGAVDASFGDQGSRFTPVAGSIERLRVIGDKIIGLGSTSLEPNNTALLIARFNNSGGLDTSFGSGTGVVVLDVSPTNDTARDVALTANGSLVIAGDTGVAPLLVRMFSDGTVDPAFGNNGIEITKLVFGSVECFQSGVRNLHIDATGSMTVSAIAGCPRGEVLFARYTSRGILDSSYGENGIAWLAVSDRSYSGTGFSVDKTVAAPDGKLLVVGQLASLFTVARIDSNGDLDLSFGDRGVHQAAIGSQSFSIALDAAVQADGKIVACGRTVVGPAPVNTGADSVFAVVRFTKDGQVDSSFGDRGVLLINNMSDNPLTGFEIARGIAVLPNGKIILFGNIVRRLDGFLDELVAVLIRLVGESGSSSQPDLSVGHRPGSTFVGENRFPLDHQRHRLRLNLRKEGWSYLFFKIHNRGEIPSAFTVRIAGIREAWLSRSATTLDGNTIKLPITSSTFSVASLLPGESVTVKVGIRGAHALRRRSLLASASAEAVFDSSRDSVLLRLVRE